MSINIQKYLSQFESAKYGRSEIESTWEEIDQIIYGKQKHKEELQDFTVRRCRNQLASYLQNMIITPNYPWFGLTCLSDEQDGYISKQEILWAQDIEAILLDAFNNPQSNFASSIRQFFLSLCAYGTASLMLEENESAPYKIFFKNVDIKECYFEEDLQGLVNVIYRNFKVQIYKVVSIFEEAAKNNLYKKLHETNRLAEVNVLHVVHPDDKKYKSVYIDIDNQIVLSEGAFDYFPYFVVRSDKENSAYGFPLAAHIFSEARMLAEFKNMIIEAAQNAIRPPLAVPQQGYGLPLNLKAGEVNFYQNGFADKIYPLYFSNPISILQEQQKCIETVYKAFYLDILHLNNQHEMTAAEVNARCLEQARILGPICSSLEFELLNPMIRSVYLTLKKFGHLPTLDGCNLDKISVYYESFVHKSHKRHLLASAQETLSFLHNTGLLRTNPELIDNINADSFINILLKAGGAPKEIFRSEPEVKRIRTERANQMDQKGK